MVRAMPNTPALIGAGVSGLYAMPGVSETERLRFQEAMAALPQAIRNAPQPVIAAVNGPCVGAGLALWALTVALWAGLTYTILPGLMEGEDKPDLGKGLSGVWLLVHIDGLVYGVGLGVFLTSYGCYVLIRRGTTVVRGNVWLDAVAGALGGLAGGLAGFPGSFVTIWCSMRGWDKVRQRAVYQPYILGMQIVTIACLRWHAPFHANVLHDLRLVPFALVGAVGGLALFQRMSNKQFQIALSVLLVVSGIGVLGRTL